MFSGSALGVLCIELLDGDGPSPSNERPPPVPLVVLPFWLVAAGSTTVGRPPSGDEMAPALPESKNLAKRLLRAGAEDWPLGAAGAD